MEFTKKKKSSNAKIVHGVPQLAAKNSDFHGWYSRLQLKLDAKGLWEDFCAKPDTVAADKDSARDKDTYEKHVQRRREARWQIERTLSPELAKTVRDIEQPYELLLRLRKMFVDATKWTLVRQLRSVMCMKYKKGQNVMTFVDELKSGFTNLKSMGLPIDDKLKPYVLVMVLDDAFDDILRPYLVQTLAGDAELKFDKVVELLQLSSIAFRDDDRDPTLHQQQHKKRPHNEEDDDDRRPKKRKQKGRAMVVGS